ncbi:AMP-binding protein [Solwaraspora sp. WMMA2065]|uniref:AMP-binding protein n=1 Tax=Solwaraspora sp. WMMA2065 TaxID=3015166 RepID=UPI00338FC3B4
MARPKPVAGVFLAERVATLATWQPDLIAVEMPGTRLTYSELAERAQAVTGWLNERGIGAADRRVVLADRAAPVYPALLGVLGTGAASDPLAPRTPVDATAPSPSGSRCRRWCAATGTSPRRHRARGPRESGTPTGSDPDTGPARVRRRGQCAGRLDRRRSSVAPSAGLGAGRPPPRTVTQGSTDPAPPPSR